MAIGAAPTRSADTQPRVLSAALVSCLRTPERHAHTKTEENIKKHNLCIKKQKTEYARICKIMFLLDNLLVANMQDYARLCFMFFYAFLCFMVLLFIYIKLIYSIEAARERRGCVHSDVSRIYVLCFSMFFLCFLMFFYA